MSSHFVRPVRRAAQLAAVRITQSVNADNANSDSDDPVKQNNDVGIIRARRHGYDNTVYIIQYLLTELESAQFEDERAEIATKMFRFINKNPNLLIYEPKFRNVIINKMQELDKHIDARIQKYQKSKYEEALQVLKLSVSVNIRNSKTRQTIAKKLEEINTALEEYETWAPGTEMKNEFLYLRNTLRTIKEHPDYVDNYPLIY
jgi:hypothetical protein